MLINVSLIYVFIYIIMKKPTIATMLKKAKSSKYAKNCGMFLVHNGVVRITPKKLVRSKIKTKQSYTNVSKMLFDYDKNKVEFAIKKAKKLPGIFYVDVWLNKGILKINDDIMYVIIGGDIRPHVVSALQKLVGEIKSKCVSEIEISK